MMEINDVSKVVIHPGRWNVEFLVHKDDGTVESFIASADSALAESGIYFSTKEEYNEWMENVW